LSFEVSAFGLPSAPDSGPSMTTVADTVYMADGSGASGTLIVTWPAFVTAGERRLPRDREVLC
jgi:hypothetical protein